MNNLNQYQDISRIFTRVTACKDRQTNQMHTHFSTLLKSVKNTIICVRCTCNYTENPLHNNSYCSI